MLLLKCAIQINLPCLRAAEKTDQHFTGTAKAGTFLERLAELID